MSSPSVIFSSGVLLIRHKVSGSQRKAPYAHQKISLFSGKMEKRTGTYLGFNERGDQGIPLD